MDGLPADGARLYPPPHTHTHTQGYQQIESPAGSYSSWCLPVFIVSSAESQTRNLSWFGWRRWEFGGVFEFDNESVGLWWDLPCKVYCSGNEASVASET